ncbi:hypothetical protein AVEN_4248-1 [Araneus ventricosus]|uniref:Uncharacterized protein n=1 Tax=Araneus ventricosus TaxID=182803 RepID=A0A4Y2Q6R6_ARAVE|nr:hypothetical protein AVEN_4248-1 [Araneus ventricosus]
MVQLHRGYEVKIVGRRKFERLPKRRSSVSCGRRTDEVSLPAKFDVLPVLLQREWKAVFACYRSCPQNFNEVEADDDFRRPNSTSADLRLVLLGPISNTPLQIAAHHIADPTSLPVRTEGN